MHLVTDIIEASSRSLTERLIWPLDARYHWMWWFCPDLHSRSCHISYFFYHNSRWNLPSWVGSSENQGRKWPAQCSHFVLEMVLSFIILFLSSLFRKRWAVSPHSFNVVDNPLTVQPTQAQTKHISLVYLCLGRDASLGCLWLENMEYAFYHAISGS